MRAMTVPVCGIIVSIQKIPTVRVVDKPVQVIIDRVPCDLSRILPYVSSEIRMIFVDARIDNRNDHGRVAGCDIPGLRSADLDHSVELAVTLVVRREIDPVDE